MGQPVFELYNSDGTLQINLASRLTKYLGAISVNLLVSGSHSDQELRGGTPWSYVYLPQGYNPAVFKNPVITFSDGVMTWTSPVGGGVTMGTIVYGVYSNGAN